MHPFCFRESDQYSAFSVRNGRCAVGYAELQFGFAGRRTFRDWWSGGQEINLKDCSRYLVSTFREWIFREDVIRMEDRLYSEVPTHQGTMDQNTSHSLSLHWYYGGSQTLHPAFRIIRRTIVREPEWKSGRLRLSFLKSVRSQANKKGSDMKNQKKCRKRDIPLSFTTYLFCANGSRWLCPDSGRFEIGRSRRV